MVSFTQHRFSFTSATAAAWFKVLEKYYSGVFCTINDSHRGQIGTKFFAEIPDEKSYVLNTERFWNQRATIRCIPKFDGLEKTQMMQTNETDEARATIQRVIDGRVESGGYEVFYTGNLTIEPDQLLPILSECDLSHVTHFYHSKADATVSLVVDNSHGIYVSCRKVCDATFGVLDLEDGFDQGYFQSCHIPSEWNVQFATWRQKFIDTDGESWNDPIIRTSFTP